MGGKDKKMNQQQAKEKLKEHLEDYVNEITVPSKKGGKGMYNCPLCESGTGENGTGAFSLNPSTNNTTFKCFACGKSGDIITLIQEKKKMDYKQALEYGLNKYRIQVDNTQEPQAEPDTKPTETPKATSSLEEKKTNYSNFYMQCQQDLKETDYFTRRGISEKVQKAFSLGYRKNWKHPKNDNLEYNAAIIPTSPFSYVARNTGEGKTRYSKVGDTSLFAFNDAFNQSEKPIFICEGEIDALSFYEVGAYAIGLGSGTNINYFLNELEKLASKRQINNKIVVCMDNDEVGQQFTETLVNGHGKGNNARSGLKTLNLAYCIAPVPKAYKDANEFLVKDRRGFEIYVTQEFKTEKELEEQQKKEQARQEYLKLATSNYIDQFLQGIESSNTKPIKTGYDKLDELLEGGLYEGLYTLGAVSSLGKTTYVLQMADQIASNGQDVLIFSLEMARNELIAKSLSRMTAIEGIKAKNINLARSTRGITDYSRYKDYSKKILDVIELAKNSYRSIADKIYIVEGVGEYGVKEVRETINRHITFTGNKPVVVIDYLQMLEPYDSRATDRQIVDHAVRELKRISRDYKLPIIAISSFNRDSYRNAVSEVAFKESGSIEYTADVLLGLQFEGTGTSNFNLTQAKGKSPRDIELVILKNRNGTIGRTIKYSYYPMFNYYEEVEE